LRQNTNVNSKKKPDLPTRGLRPRSTQLRRQDERRRHVSHMRKLRLRGMPPKLKQGDSKKRPESHTRELRLKDMQPRRLDV